MVFNQEGVSMAFRWISLVGLLCIVIGCSENFAESSTRQIAISSSQAELIGYNIWLNETSGNRENLIVWNDGEDFVSLGIGHFIWYSEYQSAPFEESFPKLLEFFEKHGTTLPAWLNSQTDCPWTTKEEFLKSTQSAKMFDLQTLLTDTVPQQVQFLMLRLTLALPKILEHLDSDELRSQVLDNFNRLAETPGGVYALVDYVNFKGEGISPTERYKGQGWGLLQVLTQMNNESSDPVKDFADAAEAILTLRTQNAPKERNEVRWLPGWKNRIDTYRNFIVQQEERRI
jgi:hypothetical protein